MERPLVRQFPSGCTSTSPAEHSMKAMLRFRFLGRCFIATSHFITRLSG